MHDGAYDGAVSAHCHSTSDRFGNADGALEFDGSNAHVALGDIPFAFDGSEPFTISFWMQPNNPSLTGQNGQNINYIMSREKNPPDGINGFFLDLLGGKLLVSSWPSNLSISSCLKSIADCHVHLCFG